MATDDNETSKKDEPFHLDAIFDYIGEFGAFQLRYWICLCYALLFPGPAILLYNFTGYIPRYRCFIPGCDNETNPDYGAPCWNGSIPSTESGGETIYDKCKRYDSYPADGNDSNVVTCDRWVFDRTIFRSTVVTDYQLTCENEWKTTFVSSLFMVGLLVGAVFLGPISDFIGRKRAYLLLSIWMISFGIATCFSLDFTTFAALRFMTSLSIISLLQTNVIWGIEVMSPRIRAKYLFALNLSTVSGNILTGIVAYFIRDWIYLHLTVFIPTVLLIPFFFLLWESPRWLVARHKYQEARNVMQIAAQLNKKSIPANMLLLPQQETEKSGQESDSDVGNVWQVMRTPCLLKRLVILSFCWAAGMFCFFGLSLSSSNLSEDIFLNYELSILVEVPAYLIGLFVLDKIGRRLTLTITLVAGGLSCLTAGLVPEEMFTLTLIFSLIGKFFISLETVSVNMTASELFPTATRGVSIAIASGMGNVGSIVAPILASLGKDNRSFPYLVFGITSTVVGLLTLLLPETKGITIPSTLQEAKDLDKYMLPCLRCKRQGENSPDN